MRRKFYEMCFKNLGMEFYKDSIQLVPNINWYLLDFYHPAGDTTMLDFS